MKKRNNASAGHGFSPERMDVPGRANAVRLVELPAGLSREGQVTVTVLVARTTNKDTGFSVWQAKNYGDEVPTYARLAVHGRFAQHGSLVADYPLDTTTIDDSHTLSVQLDGPDRMLDEQTLFDALADDTLVFIGDEVLSLAAVRLLANGRYSLSVVRNRLGSARAAHAADAEVYIVRRADLLLLNHAHFQPENLIRFKVALQNAIGEAELGELYSIELTLTGNLSAPSTTQDPMKTLLAVSNAADRSAVYKTNFEKIEAAVFQRRPSFVDGKPNTIVGPPLAGDWREYDLWVDSLLAVFRCYADGGWVQCGPAVVSALPKTAPDNYLVTVSSERWKQYYFDTSDSEWHLV